MRIVRSRRPEHSMESSSLQFHKCIQLGTLHFQRKKEGEEENKTTKQNKEKRRKQHHKKTATHEE